MATKLAEAGDKGEQVMDTFTSDERREVAARLRKARAQRRGWRVVELAPGLWAAECDACFLECEGGGTTAAMALSFMGCGRETRDWAAARYDLQGDDVGGRSDG